MNSSGSGDDDQDSGDGVAEAAVVIVEDEDDATSIAGFEDDNSDISSATRAGDVG